MVTSKKIPSRFFVKPWFKEFKRHIHVWSFKIEFQIFLLNSMKYTFDILRMFEDTLSNFIARSDTKRISFKIISRLLARLLLDFVDWIDKWIFRDPGRFLKDSCLRLFHASVLQRGLLLWFLADFKQQPWKKKKYLQYSYQKQKLKHVSKSDRLLS